MKRLIALLATALLALGLIAVAPSASASCTGAPGCSSGWYNSTVYDSSSGKNFAQNIAVSWFPDGHRRVYSSGSTCYPTYPYFCEGHDRLRIYYRVPGGPWVLKVTIQPGPPYGTYAFNDIIPSSSGSAKDWVVQATSFGTTYNSLIVRN
jgi:hypothetical protein